MYRYVKNQSYNPVKRLRYFLSFLFILSLSFPTFCLAKTATSNHSGPSKALIPFASINVRDSYVRKGSIVKSEPLDILRRGQLVVVLQRKGEWTEVQYELGRKGWIFGRNITTGMPKVLPKADRILFERGSIHGDKGIEDIYFNGAIGQKVKVFRMKAPSRIVLDIQGLKSKRSKRILLSRSQFLSEINIGVHPDKSRLVLKFKRKIKGFSYKISDKKNLISLEVSLGPPLNVKTGRMKNINASKGEVTPLLKAKVIRVTKIGFKDETGKSTVILSTTSPPNYDVKITKARFVLVLSNTQIDKKYVRFLDTSGFTTPVKKIDFRNLSDKKGGVRAEIWVTTNIMMPYDVVVKGHKLKWIFKKPKDFVARLKKVKKEKIVKEKKRIMPKPIKKRVVRKTNKKTFSKPRYTGTRMTFDFQKADIHSVLRLIAQVSHLNIVAGDDVRGSITLRLKNIPWDQALDIILQSKGLGKERIGNVIRIAPMSRLKNEMQEKISSKKVVEKLEPLITEYIPVNYTTAKDLSAKIKSLLSSRGKITVDERTNTLIVKDIPKRVSDAKDMVVKLDSPTPEVLIEARIVEANKDFTREFGIKWGATYNRDVSHGNPLSSDFPNSLNIRGGATGQAGATTTSTTTGETTGITTGGGLLPMVNLPATASYGAIGIKLEQLVDVFTLDAELTAMEDDGKGRVISSPRIATLDNKAASIEQGLRIPYLKITEEGTVTTEFIEANLNLEVTPHVSNDKMINMEIKVSKDTPDWSHLVSGVPSIDKKEAITNVMVRDGGVTAIGGIFTIEKSNSVHKVPLFGDIPILGWAFKNKRIVKNRKELLIFISPKLIPLTGSKR